MLSKVALPSLVLLTAFAVVAQAADDKKEAPKSAADAGLEQFKQLAGDWVGKATGIGGAEGHEVRVNYKVTSAGSAVVETITPGTDHEMVTVIHKDGDHLALTHYCALGNQPHMKGDLGDDKKIAFKFTGASNMKSEKDMHMHNATFTFVDKDTLKTEWTLYKDGKETGTAVFELKRKK